MQTQLWSINQTYQNSLRLLDETNAAIEMQKHGSCSLDLTGVDLHLVKSAIREVRRASSLSPIEALAVVALLQFSETLQLNLKAAIKEDVDWYIRFMPLTQMVLLFWVLSNFKYTIIPFHFIYHAALHFVEFHFQIMQLFVNRSLIKSIMEVVDEDGSIKDSAVGFFLAQLDSILFESLYTILFIWFFLYLRILPWNNLEAKCRCLKERYFLYEYFWVAVCFYIQDLFEIEVWAVVCHGMSILRNNSVRHLDNF